MKHDEVSGQGAGWTLRDCYTVTASVAAGAALGVTLMYLFDPDRGRARRHRISDQVTSKIRRAGHAIATTAEDGAHRVEGAWRRVAAGAHPHEEPVTDAVVRERVRSRLGRLVPHPHQVDTVVHEGVLALHGFLPNTDRRRLVKELGRVPGVRRVEDLLAPAV
jgi:osmotically-inducible protein OsmY